MAWFVLVGQRMAWIESAMCPLIRASWLLWFAKDKRRKVLEGTWPRAVYGCGVGWAMKDKIAGVALWWYGYARGGCTYAPENDVHELVEDGYKLWRHYRQRSSPPYKRSAWSDHYSSPNPKNPASRLEQGLPTGWPYRLQDDTRLLSLTRLTTKFCAGDECDLLPLRPKANPDRMHPAMRKGVRAVVVAYDGLLAMMESLAWETDVTAKWIAFNQLKYNHGKYIKPAIRSAAKAVAALRLLETTD